MSDTTNAHKLHILANHVVWVIATNDEQGSLLDPLPEGAEMVADAVDGMDAAVVFVEDREALVSYLDEVLPQLGSTPVIWIAYPQGNRSDITRDSIGEVVGEYGWKLIDKVSLDEIWSAVRLTQA